MKYLILDRDTKFPLAFLAILESAGVEPLRLPPRSPNLNALAEQFVRSIKEECLDNLILFGELSLQRALENYVEHYHGSAIIKAGETSSSSQPLQAIPTPTLPAPGRSNATADSADGSSSITAKRRKSYLQLHQACSAPSEFSSLLHRKRTSIARKCQYVGLMTAIRGTAEHFRHTPASLVLH